MHSRRQCRRSQGFTLIEIMVAVGILAALGVVMIASAGRSSADIALMQEKMSALHIAEYALNSVLIASDTPEVGNDEDVISRANRDWLVNVSISETENERVLRVDVLVKPYDVLGTAEERTAILLSGFKTDLTP